MSEKIEFSDFIKALDCCGIEIFVSMLLQFLDCKTLEELQNLVAKLPQPSSLKVEEPCGCYRTLSSHGPSDVRYYERNREYAIEQQNNEFFCKQKLVNYFTTLYDRAKEIRELLARYENLALLASYENEVANQMST